MGQGRVGMAVGVRFGGVDARRMAVLVVVVMPVAVLMVQWLVGVVMLMAFRQMQIEAEAHQSAGEEQNGRDGFVQEQNREAE